MTIALAVARRLLPYRAQRTVLSLKAFWLDTIQWLPTIRFSDSIRLRQLERLRGVSTSTQNHVFMLKPLRQAVVVREGTSDPQVVRDTFIGLYHLPPPEMPAPLTILDLGANIGLTVAHFAVLFPSAQILGVEIDPLTARIAELNTAKWRSRCTILTAAAWTSDSVVSFGRVHGEEFGSSVGSPGTQISVPAVSLNTLIDWLGGTVDYLKMDIEGGEQQVLKENIEWASRVRSMKIEAHPPFTQEECLAAARALGFEARPDDRHWSGVIAIRPSLIP